VNPSEAPSTNCAAPRPDILDLVFYASTDMRSWTASAALLLGSTLISSPTSVLSNPINSDITSEPTFVNDIKQCPALKAKEKARNTHEMYATLLLMAYHIAL
jgi:hypothetical protein